MTAQVPVSLWRMTMRPLNSLPGADVSCAAAHDGSDAASRHDPTRAPVDAPGTPPFTAVVIGASCAPQGPGGVAGLVTAVDDGAVVGAVVAPGTDVVGAVVV